MNYRFALVLLLAIVAPAALQADTPGWTVSSPDNAGFSAEFPSEPKSQVITSPEATTSLWTASSADGDIRVVVSLTDFWIDVTAEQELELAKTNFLKSAGGTVTSPPKRGTFPGPTGKKNLPSLVFDFETQSGWEGRSRVVVDGNTTFQTVFFWAKRYDATAALADFERTYKLVSRFRPSPPTSTAQ